MDSWTLVLLSKGIPWHVAWGEEGHGGLELHVPAELADAARSELDAYDAEEAEEARAKRADEALDREPPATAHAAFSGVLVALALLAFFVVTGPIAGGARWFALGASDAERVLHGEWWRAITALTLHADSGHVLSNMAIGAVVVGAVMHWAGIGWGATLVLASGVAGNLMNAAFYQHHHGSVGFSTAVFGAIGILAGMTYMRERRRARARRPAWTALGGALALLALLGASETSDVLAHLFGGIAGLAIGLAQGSSRWRPRSTLGQTVVGLGAATAVIGAWIAAGV
jgi:membrane associated rhomboid family serine protease